MPIDPCVCGRKHMDLIFSGSKHITVLLQTLSYNRYYLATVYKSLIFRLESHSSLQTSRTIASIFVFYTPIIK